MDLPQDILESILSYLPLMEFNKYHTLNHSFHSFYTKNLLKIFPKCSIFRSYNSSFLIKGNGNYMKRLFQLYLYNWMKIYSELSYITIDISKDIILYNNNYHEHVIKIRTMISKNKNIRDKDQTIVFLDTNHIQIQGTRLSTLSNILSFYECSIFYRDIHYIHFNDKYYNIREWIKPMIEDTAHLHIHIQSLIGYIKNLIEKYLSKYIFIKPEFHTIFSRLEQEVERKNTREKNWGSHLYIRCNGHTKMNIRCKNKIDRERFIKSGDKCYTCLYHKLQKKGFLTPPSFIIS